jgi:hypothetical protein
MKAYFYIAPWSVVNAQQQRVVAAQAENRTDQLREPREPMCCHESLMSWDSLRKDSTQLVLGHVHWGENWAAQERFEATPGVIPLGEPWEPVPAAAVPTLEAFRLSCAPTRAERVPASAMGLRPTQDPAVPIDATHTVVEALRKAAPALAHELF